MRKVDTSLIVRLCLPQFAVGLFTTMLNNYLIYFYQPSQASGIPDLIPQGRLVLGVLTIIGMIKAVGHIIDAVTDPLIVSAFKGAGMATLSAWRTTFGIYTVIGVILLLIPAYTIKETEYVHSVIPNVTLGQSLKHAFANKHFRLVTLGAAAGEHRHGVLSGVHHVLCDLADGSCGDILRTDPGHLHRRVAADVPAGEQIRQEAGQEAAHHSGLYCLLRRGDRDLLQRYAAGKPAGAGLRVRPVRVLPLRGAERAARRHDGRPRKGEMHGAAHCQEPAGSRRAGGGHKTPVMRMAAFIAEADEKKPYIRRLHPEVRGMFERLLIKLIPKLNAADARQFTDLSDAVIRFAPIDIDKQQYASVHGENENISVDKLHLAVDFYKALLRNYPADAR